LLRLAIACYSAPSRLALDAHCSPKKTQFATFRGISKLERALTMIDDPDFGLCCECEEPIPFARLMIMPESDLCVKCAEAIHFR